MSRLQRLIEAASPPPRDRQEPHDEAVTTTQARARLVREAKDAVKEARAALQDLYGVASPGAERRTIEKAYNTSKTLWALIADLKP